MVPDAVRSILSSTFLTAVPEPVALSVLEEGQLLVVKTGQILKRQPQSPGVAIVVQGLVRVFLVSPQERQVTVRYARSGDVLGLEHLCGAKFVAHAQAVAESQLFRLSGRRLHDQASRSNELAMAMARECAALVADAVDEIVLLTFGSVRQRVARHLLDLAAADLRGDELVALVTQQELADATGSVREVVARVLKELEASRIVRRTPKGVVVIDATRLDAESRGTAAPRQRRQESIA